MRRTGWCWPPNRATRPCSRKPRRWFTAPERNPVPASGVVPIRGVALGGDLLMRFDWAAPVPAAAFRRGEAIWIVFAAEADLDAGELLRGHRRHILDIDQFTGEGYTALRITAPLTRAMRVSPKGVPTPLLTVRAAERSRSGSAQAPEPPKPK